MSEGRFTIPAVIYLSPQHRAKLMRLIELEELRLPELLSDLLSQHLDTLPDPPPEPAPTADKPALQEALKQRRVELRRLAARMAVADGPPPEWMTQYINDLRGEIARLERELAG